MTILNNNEVNYPLVRCISQEIKAPKVNDVKELLLERVKEYDLASYINQGDSVALTASSRGIKDQADILRVLITHLKNLGASPFVIPAMGSHGGGTVEGQLQILNDFSINEESIGCPIKATMDVVEVGRSEFGYPIYIDRYAAEANKIIVINKIKSHSKFVGEVESGLSKMCVIGLGKHKGAKLYHQLFDHYSWQTVLKSYRRYILQKVPIICGLAIIQNINNETAEIHILHPNEFEQKEPKLLQRYKKLNEHIPFHDIDLLIVDEMGKNIFGTGMDTNITGRKPMSSMKVQWVFVRDLTSETRGNAQGVGLADFTTKKLVDKINYSKTYTNALTAYRTDSPKIPIFLKNDQEVLKTIFNMYDINDFSDFKLVWIKNTLELRKIIVSEALFDQVSSRDNLQFDSEEEKIEFDKDGFLINSKKYW